MVESINKLHPQLNLHAFVNMDVFPQTQIRVVNCLHPHVGKVKRQRAQVVCRTSAVCRAGRERGAGRSGPQEVNKGISIEPTGQSLLVLRNGNLSAQVERITAKPQREAGLESISSLDLRSEERRVGKESRS